MDINTLRFFYNLGIEVYFFIKIIFVFIIFLNFLKHYRVCLVTNNNAYNVQPNYSNNCIQNPINHQSVTMNTQQISNGQIDSIAINHSNNACNSLKSNTNSSVNLINNQDDTINNKSTIIDNNNNLISNQLVPNLNIKTGFSNQQGNNQSRRLV